MPSIGERITALEVKVNTLEKNDNAEEETKTWFTRLVLASMIGGLIGRAIQEVIIRL